MFMDNSYRRGLCAARAMRICISMMGELLIYKILLLEPYYKSLPLRPKTFMLYYSLLGCINARCYTIVWEPVKYWGSRVLSKHLPNVFL